MYVSHIKLYAFHQGRGEAELARKSLAACYAILDSFAKAGRPMDAQMRGLHAKLKPLFEK